MCILEHSYHTVFIVFTHTQPTTTNTTTTAPSATTRKFEISGQQMEDRGAEAVLLGIMRRCLGTTAIERYRAQREQDEHSSTAGLRSSSSSAARNGISNNKALSR